MENLTTIKSGTINMKLNILLLRLVFLLLLTPIALQAQENRTTKTKVADVLTLLPADNHDEAKRLFKQVLDLDDEGLAMITDGVKPNGIAEGVPNRYAVSLLTHYATSKEEKSRIENTYLAALSKSTDPEVKEYFIYNLQLVGTDKSVKQLGSLIADKDAANHAIGTLVTIGTQLATETLYAALENQSGDTQIRLIKAMGELKYKPALVNLSKFAQSAEPAIAKQALWSLAMIGDGSSSGILLERAQKVNFKTDPTQATNALVEYMHQLSNGKDRAVLNDLSNKLLAGTTDPSQQQFRLAALKELAKSFPAESPKLISQELTRFDAEYRKEVLNIAIPYANDPATLKTWDKIYKKSSGDTQAEILSMLARANGKNEAFANATLVPALSSKNSAVRIAAADEIGRTGNKNFAEALADYLVKCGDDAELQKAKSALLQVTDKQNAGVVASKIENAPSKNKVAILQVLAQKRATNYFDIAIKQRTSADTAVSHAANDALPNLSSAKNVSQLLTMLAQSKSDKESQALQRAVIAGLDKDSTPLVMTAYENNKLNLLPVLPFVNDKNALRNVVSTFYHGNQQEKDAAFQALASWQNPDAARTLLQIRKQSDLKKYHEQASQAYVTQVSKSTLPDDEKLLMLREFLSVAESQKEKTAAIRAVGGVRSFLALVFVSSYLDDPALSGPASRAAMQIALPTADARPGLTGVEVRNILQRILDKLSGEDSQYERIDIATYLQKLPYTKGYEPIFNGKDLTGWHSVVENPIARAKMTKEELAKKQAEADAKIKNNWSVKDGMIMFSGDGANLGTTRPYGDFEMLVDWKISKNGDSGIYLRGSPQVQIWDTSRVDVGAQVGSGGLYNNQKNKSTPLVVADNPVGEWNTFYIKMIGDKVTVQLNGVLVVDNVTMENYWDRSLPIFAEEAIELQAHGTELAFRNLYVKELSYKPFELPKEEKDQGFEVLFNGKDLNNWTGNKTDYVVEDNVIAVYPAKESHGNLNTEKEYSDFIFRFDFQLTPGANNGLGIHAPLEGDVAYVGKEIQILDNTAPVYAKLEPWQYHGSVYGVIAAKRDFLKPVGEWNTEEVYVKGDYIKVTLNGTVILEGDMKKASKNGTLDKHDHPGLDKHKGHIAFLGHGTTVKFRNIRIKELSK
jgi:hypothetical protein